VSTDTVKGRAAQLFERGLQTRRGVKSSSSSQLTLSEDDTGLHFVASLDPDDPDSQMLGRKLGRRDLDGQCSFCFQATTQQWDDSLAPSKRRRPARIRLLCVRVSGSAGGDPLVFSAVPRAGLNPGLQRPRALCEPYTHRSAR
jgi:hypothetical protein